MGVKASHKSFKAVNGGIVSSSTIWIKSTSLVAFSIPVCKLWAVDSCFWKGVNILEAFSQSSQLKWLLTLWNPFKILILLNLSFNLYSFIFLSNISWKLGFQAFTIYKFKYLNSLGILTSL